MRWSVYHKGKYIIGGDLEYVYVDTRREAEVRAEIAITALKRGEYDSDEREY